MKEARAISEDNFVSRRHVEKIINRQERDEILEHPMRNPKGSKKFMRVTSQTALWSDVQRATEVRPMHQIDVIALKEMQF